MRDTFVFYRSIYESAIHLPKLERGEFLECVIEYSLNGELKELPDGVVRAMFEGTKINIDRQLTNYKNGAKPKRTRSKTEATLKPKANYKEKEKEKDTYIIPNGINIKAFESWCEYKGKRYSIKAKTLASNLLIKYDKVTQQEMVDKSIMNGWKGLFDPKKQFNNKNEPQVGSVMWQLEQEQKEKDYVDVQIESS